MKSKDVKKFLKKMTVSLAVVMVSSLAVPAAHGVQAMEEEVQERDETGTTGEQGGSDELGPDEVKEDTVQADEITGNGEGETPSLELSGNDDNGEKPEIKNQVKVEEETDSEEKTESEGTEEGEQPEEEYRYRKVMHSEKDGKRTNEKIEPNPKPGDPEPMYIGKRVRHDKKHNFEPKPLPWKYPKK